MTNRVINKHGLTLVKPNWVVPSNIHAFATTRIAGNHYSESPYHRFNLANHVEDSDEQVLANRHFLQETLGLEYKQFCWLNQQHTVNVERLGAMPVSSILSRPLDASWTNQSNLVPVVMTADCLPILLTNQAGTIVSAVHAGWKGALDGIIQNAVLALPEAPENLIAWIGPAISQAHFEVGDEVFQSFVSLDEAFSSAFGPSKKHPKRKMMNLPKVAEMLLNQLGVVNVTQSDLCTYEEEDWFYSYRRDGITGRIASFIYLN